jgi:5'-nucleotidase
VSRRPLILISNDDGIESPGLKALVNSVKDLGDITVVAPDSPQSGMGHAITVSEPLRLEEVQDFGPSILAYRSNGTPADCVKLAVSIILHQKPDIVISGVNHGSNSSINAIYSGTVSAAMEGVIEGVPAAAFSLLDYAIDAAMEPTQPYTRRITQQLLENNLPKGVLLNVNIPASSETPLAGVKVCRQAHAKWQENFDEREDPTGRKYYWLVGNFVNYDEGEDTDEYALHHNYVAVTPIQYDLTAYQTLSQLNHWKMDPHAG